MHAAAGVSHPQRQEIKGTPQSEYTFSVRWGLQHKLRIPKVDKHLQMKDFSISFPCLKHVLTTAWSGKWNLLSVDLKHEPKQQDLLSEVFKISLTGTKIIMWAS